MLPLLSALTPLYTPPPFPRPCLCHPPPPLLLASIPLPLFCSLLSPLALSPFSPSGDDDISEQQGSGCQPSDTSDTIDQQAPDAAMVSHPPSHPPASPPFEITLLQCPPQSLFALSLLPTLPLPQPSSPIPPSLTHPDLPPFHTPPPPP